MSRLERNKSKRRARIRTARKKCKSSAIKVYVLKKTENPVKKCRIVGVKKAKRGLKHNRDLKSGRMYQRALPPLDFPDDDPPVKK